LRRLTTAATSEVGIKGLRIWLALAGFLTVTAQAHRLSLTWERVGTNVVVTAATEGTPSAGASVECLTDSGGLWAAGTLDEQGRFAVGIPTGGGLAVSVNAGLGHRRSLTISASELQAAGMTGTGSDAKAMEAGEGIGGKPVGGSTDAGFSTLPRVLLGLALLLAAAGAWMSVQNSRRLAAIERRLKSDAR
jgi:hypothetical protein